MKKFFMMLPLMVALVAMVGCKKTTDEPVSGENLNEGDAYYTQFDVKDFGVFGSEPEMIAGTQTTIQVSESETADAQLGYTEIIAWGNGVSFNNQTGVFSGSGWMIDLPRVPILFITSGTYAGYYLNPENGIRVATTTTPTEGVCAPGTIDAATYGDWINYLMFQGNEPDSATVFGKTKGALFCYQFAEAEYQEWNLGVYRGFINKMVINLDEEGAIDTWGADINYANVTGDQRCYGFHFTVGADSVPVMTKPYNYRSVNKAFNESILNAPQAPARRAPRAFKAATLRKPYAALKK